MAVTAMNHFTVLTDDLPATLAFYAEHLDLKPGARPPSKFPGAWLYVDGGKGRDPILHIVAGIGRERLVKGVLDHMAFYLRHPWRRTSCIPAVVRSPQPTNCSCAPGYSLTDSISTAGRNERG